MVGNLTSLLVAVVGVFGTLGAAALTQRHADRTKRLEMEQDAAQRAEDRRRFDALRADREAKARRDEHVALRRACYVGVSRTARQYLTALRDHVHALEDGRGAEVTGERLEARRAAYRDSYAEAQMIVPAGVLGELRSANAGLNAAYGALKRLEAGTDGEAGSWQGVRDVLAERWKQLAELRDRMRHELGVDAGAGV